MCTRGPGVDSAGNLSYSIISHFSVSLVSIAFTYTKSSFCKSSNFIDHKLFS